MSYQSRRPKSAAAPSKVPDRARTGGVGFGSNSARAAQLQAHDPQAMLDAQAGDVDALIGGWSTLPPSLEVTEDRTFSRDDPSGALSAAMRDPMFAECAFGQTTRDLRDAPHLLVESRGHSITASDLPKISAAQLRYGLAAEGWMAEDSLESVFTSQIDAEGVYLNSISMPSTGESFDWIEFFMGDTEVGYIFRSETTSLVGCIGDGEIYDCQIRLPEGL
jgi:hypothetical protein